MRKLAAIARTGLAAVLLHRARSGATLVCLVAVLTPYVAGVAVAHGLLRQADASIREGADLHVTGARFGRPAPVPLAGVATVRAIPGVRAVAPRIVGETVLGTDEIEAVVVGVPAAGLPESIRCVEGEPFGPGASRELVMGTELARRLGLRVGSLLPPFYRNRAGELVSKVVGLFRTAEAPPWAAHLVFCSFETAAEIFDQDGFATGLRVACEPGYTQDVRDAIRRLPRLGEGAHAVTPVVRSREDVRAYLPRSLRHLEGIFHLHFVLAFAVGIPLVMMTAGLGLAERRREAALLKATGWMTDEVLLQGFVESVVLCVLGASLAIVAAWVWLDPLNGRFIAGIFLPGAAADPAFEVPFDLAPVPALLAFAVAFAIVCTGTLYSIWRAATARPAVALR